MLEMAWEEVEKATEKVSSSPPDLDFGAVDADWEDEESLEDENQPLLIFYDCETTGLSIYSDHITDIAAKVVTCQCLIRLSPAW
jgi:uncharacterized protein YprB with RNaseH-like and TPR domain